MTIEEKQEIIRKHENGTCVVELARQCNKSSREEEEAVENVPSSLIKNMCAVGMDFAGKRSGWRGILTPRMGFTSMNKMHLCPYCAYTTNFTSHLKEHIRTHTGEKPYSCPHCSYCATTKDHLKKHIRTHTGEKPYACPQCNDRFTQKPHLTSHMRNWHRNTLETAERRPLQMVLGSDGQTLDRGATGSCKNLSSTMKMHHCPYCVYTTSFKTNLKTHLRTHTGEKPFACPQCPYSATTKACLKRHFYFHTGEKPFSCPNCQYSATTKDYLNRHMRTHTSEMFECPHCPYRFVDQSSLKHHVHMIHQYTL
ncbi:zinc finger protein 33B-like [Procambarus clarkii]|uniref:zinc finger protein 33B-like n=1 Tax=Procambarus clarkii TaxID=6728 RepID=UPI0037444EE2